jgi:hypothetical protein
MMRRTLLLTGIEAVIALTRLVELQNLLFSAYRYLGLTLLIRHHPDLFSARLFDQDGSTTSKVIESETERRKEIIKKPVSVTGCIRRLVRSTISYKAKSFLVLCAEYRLFMSQEDLQLSHCYEPTSSQP